MSSDGDSVAMEGFTHLIPFAAGHEVIRQGRKRLTLIRMTPDLIYDQLIGMGCAEKLVFSWGGNPGVGSLHRLRDAVENGWPHPLALEEHSHAAMANAYEAGAANLPFAMFRGYKGVDLPKVNPAIRSVTCPYTGEVLATVPALRPDVAIIHALRADRAGNVLLEGIVGVQKEAVLAAKRVHRHGRGDGRRFRAAQPERGDPAGLDGHGHRRGARRRLSVLRARLLQARQRFLQGWDAIARDRETFRAWMEENVLKGGPEDFAHMRSTPLRETPLPLVGRGWGRGSSMPHSRDRAHEFGATPNRTALRRPKARRRCGSIFGRFGNTVHASDAKLRSETTSPTLLGCRRRLSSRLMERLTNLPSAKNETATRMHSCEVKGSGFSELAATTWP